MEIMTTPSSTNSHNQKELRLYAPSGADEASSMAMATTTNGARSPFQREVREWQRIDPDTGALLTGRLEADRWINGPLNSYGKISDSQNISQPNGTQQTQRKQLEVIQTCTAGGGAMQVIRSQTVQTTSSRWSTTSSSATASPSPPSLLPPQACTDTEKPTPSPSPKDKYLKSNSKQTTHKRTTTSTSSSATTSSPFTATNGFHHPHHHNKHHTKYHQPITSTKTARTTNSNSNSKSKTNSTTSSNSKSNSRPLGHNLVNGKRNWPQIVTENMSSTLDICDNDHDNEHVHDNDYIVEQISDDNDNVDDKRHDADDDDEDSLLDGHHHHHHHHHQHHYLNNHHNNDEHDNGDDVDDDDDDHEDVEDSNRFLLNKSSNFSKPQTFASFGVGSHGSDNDNDNATKNVSDDLHNQHLHHDFRNGHNSSSSSSSLNSHSGNSCSNSNQLFLLDTAPSLKLSNLMKSSSSISNSSNNSTTASQSVLASSTLSSNLNTNANINSSMNTHKSMASKISLHAIVGNNSSSTSPSDHTTKTTASSTPSPTTTATPRPSWQQPTLFRQNSHNNSSNNNNSNNNNHHHHNRISPIPNPSQSQSTKLKHTHSSSSHSHSHLTKSRVGDNNCCGSSSDESRSYADLRHHRQHQHQRQSPSFQLKQQNDRLTPTQSALRQQQQQHYNRVDLESFRHYNNNNDNNHNSSNDTYVAADVDDDGLRLSSRHLRRQQIPVNNISPITTTLQRSRSISTDDLSTEWDINGADNEEPAEWRRVSKLRRSFQSSSKTQPSTSSNSRRPLDLPTNSVSVSKIRAELENGRRLNTVMKNNHVDLAALSSILNGTDKDNKSSPTPKRSSFLTAESLKEIRGKLKKLSDESLYKEDFIINQHNGAAQLPEREHIEVQPATIRKSVERSPDRYQLGALRRDPSPLSANLKHRSPDRYRLSGMKRDPSPMSSSPKHTTNSLESRLKYKETNPTEWHLRRKSYGFEKMSPPDKSMVRMDASTDSGLGRSGELQNWSPTSEAAAAANRNSTVVHFKETHTRTSVAANRRYRPQKSFEESENSPEEDMAVNKRHSIAVDESQYVRDNGRQTTQVRLNGFYDPSNEGKFLHMTETSQTTTAFSQKGQQKRVEFCKTEVHFATESGRVNIVETDSKPPPTNNFRRRRSRSSSVGPLQSLVKSATTVSTTSSALSAASSGLVAMPVTLFGDDNLRRKTIASTTVAYRAPLMDAPETKEPLTNVTVTIPESYGLSESSRSSYASTSGVDTTDYETDEMTSLRGILKNKPAKPKPYVLGENIDKPDELWGVQLKPVQGKSEGLGRALNDSPILSTAGVAANTSTAAQQKSVAERIRLVEQHHEFSPSPSLSANGFSTKINLSLGSANGEELGRNRNWEETDLPKSNVMSIKLHSPQATTEAPAPLKVVPPVAKPRTVTSVQETQSCRLHATSATSAAAATKQPPFQTSLPTKDSLKIIKEARGARQLRDHELSYFGVPLTKSEHDKLKTKLSTNSTTRNSPKRSLPLRRLSEETSVTGNEDETRSHHWQLDHDKPDLLKHNPIVQERRKGSLKPAERTSLKKKAELAADEEHLYENIANEITPVFKVKDVYDRKMDLKRDAMILSEMNESADQALRELSDEAALKDRKRRSLQRRNSKPLETIDEKAITEKITDTCIAVKVTRGTFASEAKKTSRHSTPSPSRVKPRERTSSQSSVECCPRARSRSLSSEKEYENIKAPTKPSRSTQMVRHKSHKPQTQSRSSSLDSQRSCQSQYSSGEEQQLRNSFRREDRSRTKTKRVASSNSSSLRHDKVREDKPTKSSHSESKRSSSTTHSSTHRERVECPKDNAIGHTTPIQHSKHHHEKSSPSNGSALQRSAPVTGSGRRDSQRIKRSTATTGSGRSTTERYDKQENSARHSATRSSREDERNNTARSSSHRLERGDKDKEKLSKSSKGHSSRSTSQQHHHERATTATASTTFHSGQEKRASSKESKTKSSSSAAASAADNTTYVSVTNLAQIPNENYEILDHNEKRQEITLAATRISAEREETSITETTKVNGKVPPPKPPRKKRKQSLIPIAIPTKPDRIPPLPPPLTPASDSPTYEYKLKSQIIPPTYSNQSTLRKSSLPRPTSRLALLARARKPSLKTTQSTSSSFAFLPYLPAKRNSDVSHVYDNYMLYAVPAAISSPKAYQQNLVNDHAQLFGSSGNRYHGYGGKGLRRRTVRSSVSTHQPFGICTCS